MAKTNAERQADFRARQRAERDAAERDRRERLAELAATPLPADPVGALVEWAAETLTIPPGHPAAGEAMALPDFAVSFLRDSWTAHESALSVARKNAKSAFAAVLVLGHLCGPLARPGWRGAVASITKPKAAELRAQVAAIAEASALDVTVKRSPYPGTISTDCGEFEVLAAYSTQTDPPIPQECDPPVPR